MDSITSQMILPGRLFDSMRFPQTRSTRTIQTLSTFVDDGEIHSSLLAQQDLAAINQNQCWSQLNTTEGFADAIGLVDHYWNQYLLLQDTDVGWAVNIQCDRDRVDTRIQFVGQPVKSAERNGVVDRKEENGCQARALIDLDSRAVDAAEG